MDPVQLWLRSCRFMLAFGTTIAKLNQALFEQAARDMQQSARSLRLLADMPAEPK